MTTRNRHGKSGRRGRGSAAPGDPPLDAPDIAPAELRRADPDLHLRRLLLNPAASRLAARAAVNSWHERVRVTISPAAAAHALLRLYAPLLAGSRTPGAVTVATLLREIAGPRLPHCAYAEADAGNARTARNAAAPVVRFRPWRRRARQPAS